MVFFQRGVGNILRGIAALVLHAHLANKRHRTNNERGNGNAVCALLRLRRAGGTQSYHGVADNVTYGDSVA